MKQLKIITIGIFAVLLIIGLSGCIDDIDATSKNIDGDDTYTDTTSPTIISLSELKDHPNRYLNKTATIKAFFSRSEPNHHRGDYFVIYTKDGFSKEIPIDISISDLVDEDMLMMGEEYYFTGVLKYGNFTSYDGENGIQKKGLHFEINSYETVYKDESKIITLKNIADHPPAYMKKTIIVQAKINNDFSEITGKKWYNYDLWMKINTDDTDTSILIPDGEYYFTGILGVNKLHIEIGGQWNTQTTLCDLTLYVENIVYT